MSGESPDSVLYDSTGKELAVQDGGALPNSAILIAGSDGYHSQFVSTDTSGHLVTVLTDGYNQASFAPANTDTTASQPALVVGISPNSLQQDRTIMSPGTQYGFVAIGQSSNIGRNIAVNRLGNVTPGYQTLLAADVIEGTSINTWMWSQSVSSMTIAQTTGVLTLNNSAITTSGAYAIITSNRQFPIVNQAAVACSFRANIAQSTNAVNEIGFGTPVGNTAVVSNGAFFRISSSGTIKVVISYNGVESLISSLPGVIPSTSYFLFEIVIEDNGIRFIVEDANGVPLIDNSLPLSTTLGGVTSLSHLPAFARVYNSGVAGSAPQTKIASFQAWQYGINTSKPFSSQMASCGRDSGVSPITYTQTTQLNNGTAPTVFTPSNTVAGNAFLGGEAAVTMTATNENLLSVFAYQIPAPYSFVLDSIYINAPVATTAFGATATILEWVLIYNASGGNLSTATGQIRKSLGFHTIATSASVGTLFNGGQLQYAPNTPIYCNPGGYVHLAVKVVLGAATGAYRCSANIGGFFE